MTLIKSISGIRGTIGGGAGEGLNPLDIVKFTSAYATLIRKTCTVKSNKIVVGRDARISGEMVKNVVVGTLMGMGWDVVDIDLASTPTTELAVTMEGASGGIILTASHNPKQWNALKLLNEKGEFLNKEEGNEVLRIAEAEEFDFAEVDKLGSYRKDLTYNQKHIDSVLALDLVDVEAIRKADFRVAIDCVNSVGGIILPQLLEQLGVKHVEKLYCEPTGNFQHNPEPLEKNLGDIMNLMKGGKADVAFVVDPDVDRLAMICEDGKMYGDVCFFVRDGDITSSVDKFYTNLSIVSLPTKKESNKTYYSNGTIKENDYLLVDNKQIKSTETKKIHDNITIIYYENGFAEIIQDNQSIIVEKSEHIIYDNNILEIIDNTKEEKVNTDNLIDIKNINLKSNNKKEVNYLILIEETSNYNKYNVSKRLPNEYIKYLVSINNKKQDIKLLNNNIKGTNKTKGLKLTNNAYQIYEGKLPKSGEANIKIGMWVDYQTITNEYMNSAFIGTVKVYIE